LTELEKRQQLDDGLGEADFNNKLFRIASPEDYISDYVVDGETGDPCNDAIWKRNGKIENRFHVMIQSFDLCGDDFVDMVLTEQNECELASYQDYCTYEYVTSEVVQNWLDIDVLNLEQPWYNQLSNDSSKIMSVLYPLCSDLSISTLTYTYALYANPTLLEAYGYSSSVLYEWVVP